MTEILLRDPQLKADPYPVFARLRREAPVCRGRGVTRMYWVVTRYDDVVTVLNDRRFVADRRNAPVPAATLIEKLVFRIYGPLLRNMLGSDNPDHARLRRLVQQAFTMRRVEQLRGRVEELTNEYLDRVERRPQWDVMADYALPLPVTMISEMLGVAEAERAQFRRYSDTLVQSFGASLSRMVRHAPTMVQFLSYIRKMVRRRREVPGDDLISGLVLAEEAGDRLTEDELVSMILLLLVAGHETTVNLIGNGVLALLENPDQREKLCANPALLPLAVEEFARYYSPVDFANARYTICDVDVGGTRIPAGQAVLASLTSANRDEAKFERPYVLDIGREPNRHLAFGHGMHHCLGIFLARLEAQVAFATLLRRCPELRLIAPGDALRWRSSLLLRGLQALPVSSSADRCFITAPSANSPK